MTDDAKDPRAVAELQGIHKRYGKVDALQGVDLEIQPRELVALLGPNGAGKTTAVSILLASAAPTPGRPGCSAATRPYPRPAARSESPSRRAGSPTTSPPPRWSTGPRPRPRPRTNGGLARPVRPCHLSVSLEAWLAAKLPTNCTTPVIKAKVATAISSHFLLTVRHHPLH